MRFFLVIGLVLFMFPMVPAAQEGKPKGGVTIEQDAAVTRMMDSFIRINKRNSEIDGYRVQIYFESGSNSKRLANEARDLFLTRYPDVKAYLLFKEPYYQVRVGNFRNSYEATGFQKKISGEYPNAFPVKDKISFKDL